VASSRSSARCRHLAFGALLVGVLGQESGGVGGRDQAGPAPLALQAVQRLGVDACGEVGYLAAYGRVQVVEHGAAGAEGPAVGAGAQTGHDRRRCSDGGCLGSAAVVIGRR